MHKPRRQYVVTGINVIGYRWLAEFTVKREAERVMRAERVLLNRWLRDNVLPRKELLRSLRSLRMKERKAPRA